MKIKDVMTKDIVFVNSGASVLEAAKLMSHHNIGCVPVMENSEKVVGVITDRDIVLRMVALNKSPEKMTVDDIMTAHVFSVQSDAEVDDATELMRQKQIRRLPVVDDGLLVGIVALGDFAVTGDCKTEASEALTEISKPSRVRNI
jgi:CBS domain-containing protein